jgi:hypothetical protein
MSQLDRELVLVCWGFERRSDALNVIHGVVNVRGWMDASDQPSSGVATRPSYSLQVNIGGTGKVRDIRLEGGYSAKQLVDLLGQLGVFFHRVSPSSQPRQRLTEP